MAITADGYIARENDDTPWSQEEFGAYYDFVRKRGNVIVGMRTYEFMREGGEFEKAGNPTTIVLSRVPLSVDNVKTFSASSPHEALRILQDKGFQEIVVGGGAMLNASFLKEGLLDEIYLDVEPLIFGKGIKLFGDSGVEAKLKLLEAKNLSENTMQLHYQVLK